MDDVAGSFRHFQNSQECTDPVTEVGEGEMLCILPCLHTWMCSSTATVQTWNLCSQLCGLCALKVTKNTFTDKEGEGVKESNVERKIVCDTSMMFHQCGN